MPESGDSRELPPDAFPSMVTAPSVSNFASSVFEIDILFTSVSGRQHGLYVPDRQHSGAQHSDQI
jgi:hypothetical protein